MYILVGIHIACLSAATNMDSRQQFDSTTRRHPDSLDDNDRMRRKWNWNYWIAERPKIASNRKERRHELRKAMSTKRNEFEIPMTEDDETTEGNARGWRRITIGDYTGDIDDSTDLRTEHDDLSKRTDCTAIRSTTRNMNYYPDAATRNGTMDDTGARTDVGWNAWRLERRIEWRRAQGWIQL